MDGHVHDDSVKDMSTLVGRQDGGGDIFGCGTAVGSIDRADVMGWWWLPGYARSCS